ncbi:MAG: hypothetical protein J7M26_02940 [Armatimonadetes bacterium]|nr:hypothetical protein [Armatimonadota bacterium]
MAIASIAAIAPAARAKEATAPPGWRVVVHDDFDSATVDLRQWRPVPAGTAGVAFDDHAGGKAVHVRAEGHDVGLHTRVRVEPPFRLSFDFMQPAAEAGGYKLIVAHFSGEGHSFWFEFDKTGLGVWTLHQGGWKARWTAAGFTPDTWYHVEIDNEEERVQVRVFDAAGKAKLAESPWLPHDLVSAGSVAFLAGSGGGLRGCLFDNITLLVPAGATVRRKTSGVDRALHEAMSTAEPARSGGMMSVATRDGLRLMVDRAGVVRGLTVDGQAVVLSNPSGCGGWWAWDVGGKHEYHRFAQKPGAHGRTLELTCEGLGLELEVRIEPREKQIDFTGELRDLRGEDRAIVLVWALPVDAEGWQWGDNLLASRKIDEAGEYAYQKTYLPAGPLGRHRFSTYPWACLTHDKTGLILARPLDWPRLVAFSYDLGPDQRFLAARIELGLSPLTKKFPSRASFKLALSKVPQAPAGFRAAVQRYYELYPEFFVKRVKREGIWHLWLTTKVQHPEDFALVFHEQEPYLEDRVKFDETHGGYSLTYSEPSTLWQKTKAWTKEGKFDPAAFLHEVQQRAAQPLSELSKYPFWTQPQGVPDAEIAQALLHSYMGKPGAPSLFAKPPDRVAVNCNGDPELDKPSRASLWFDYEGKPALTDKRVDGAYLDSLGWNAFDAVENERTEQWATADLPLVPSFRTGKPVQLGGFAHYELYRAIADAVHERGKLVLANTFPYAQAFSAHLLDVLGAGEAADLQVFHDPEKLGFCRVMAYHKPVSHMNYAYLKPDVPLAEKEIAMQRTLVYAVWPGTGDGGKLGPLEAVRPLYKKYMPIFGKLTAAGWEPITCAQVNPEQLIVERYGALDAATIYLVVHNPTEKVASARLMLGQEIPLSWKVKQLQDLVSGEKYVLQGRRVAFGLGPYQTMVLAVPNPEISPDEELRHDLGMPEW